MCVGWLEILVPDITNPMKMISFFAFFPGDHCRDQEAMHKIGMSPVCYNKLELRADE